MIQYSNQLTDNTDLKILQAKNILSRICISWCLCNILFIDSFNLQLLTSGHVPDHQIHASTPVHIHSAGDEDSQNTDSQCQIIAEIGPDDLAENKYRWG